jgi:hypothetical protein
MSLQTYSDLQSAIAGWIARNDLTSNIPDFIAIFEAVANRRLRLRQQELSVTLTPVSAVVPIPVDYLTWRRLTWTGSTPRELEYVHPTYLHALYPNPDQGLPRVFTIEGQTLTVRPSDDTPLTFDYFQKIPSLSITNTTNWLMTAAPDLYLWGSLCETHGFVKDYEALSAWAARRDQLFEELDQFDAKTRGPAAIRVLGYTP